MYIPRQYAMDADRLARFFAEPQAGQLVTATADGPEATILPVFHRSSTRGHGSFVAHMSRINPQWQRKTIGEALLILSGPDGYVSSTWMPEVLAAGKAIPTWDYLTVHAYGRLIVHDDPEWARDAAAELTQALQPGYDMDALPEPYRTGQLRAIVGIELQVTRVEAKAKLSQNRSLGDLEALVDNLRANDASALADEVQSIACPYAAQRDEVVSAAAERYRASERA